MHGMAPSDSVRSGTLPATVARPRVVILGAGFGGLNAAQALKSAPVDVTVIDRRRFERLRGIEAAKACAEDHDAGP